MKLVDSAQMSAIDARSQREFGFPSIVLMENAGVKATAALRRYVMRGALAQSPMTFVCGKGANGGDALVMARQLLMKGFTKLSVVLAAERPGEETDAGRNLLMAEKLGIRAVSYTADRRGAEALIADSEWLFDGIAGTGLRGRLSEPLAEVAAARAVKIAVDVPSGLGDGFKAGFPAVRADYTLTMGLPKRCLYLPHARILCGVIIVVPLGFPPSLVNDPVIRAELLEGGSFRRLMPEIRADAHKNTRGHLAVFAGSPGTTGAAWLAATAAARARLGLVTAFLGKEEYPTLAVKLASVMAAPWSEAEPEKGFDAARFSGILVGPGWGLSPARQRWLERIIMMKTGGVIDADGLTLLGRLAEAKTPDLGGRWVLTPHPGEFTRLSGMGKDAVMDDPYGQASAQAVRLNAVVVLKGACTYIAEPSGSVWVHDGMNPALATGGSGDVLAGLIAAGIAGGMSATEAALFGVSLHGRIGRIARRKIGWFLAEDLLPLVSRVLGLHPDGEGAQGHE
jgi:hydroxyethylthiazole kinase-like uncharacterized protein yjeF